MDADENPVRRRTACHRGYVGFHRHDPALGDHRSHKSQPRESDHRSNPSRTCAHGANSNPATYGLTTRRWKSEEPETACMTPGGDNLSISSLAISPNASMTEK